MLRLQVVPARRRGRPRPLLDLRAARLRGAGGLDAAVPRPRPHRPRGRAHQLRRGGPQERRPAAERHQQGGGGRGAHARHPPARARAGRAGRARVPPGPVRRHLDPGRRRRPPLVLDGQPAVRQGQAGVHDQALPRRALLRPARLGRDLRGHRAGDPGPLRGLHPARPVAAAAAVHRRRGRHGADPVPAALARRARRSTARGLLLRRPHGGRPVPPRRARGAGGAAAVVPLRARAVRGRVGGRDRPHHRRRRALRAGLRRRRRLRVRSAAHGRGRPGAADGQGHPRVAHLLRQVHDHRDGGDEHAHEHRDAPQGTQRPQARLHRRRSRLEGVPLLDQPHVQLLHAGQAPRDASTRTSPSTSSPIPSATSPRAGSTASPTAPAATRRSGRSSSPPTGTCSSIPTRSGSRRSTATTRTSSARSSTTSPTPRRRTRSRSGTASGSTSSPSTCSAWAHAEHGPRHARLHAGQPRRADEHDQQRAVGRRGAQAALRAGRDPLQPRARRGDRGLRRPGPPRDLAGGPDLAEDARERRAADGARATGRRRSSPPRSCSSRWSASCSAAAS